MYTLMLSFHYYVVAVVKLTKKRGGPQEATDSLTGSQEWSHTHRKRPSKRSGYIMV